LPGAEVLISFQAEFTLAARPVHPRNSGSISNLQIADVSALFDHAPRNFVAEDERSLYDCRQLAPISVRYMQVGMAHAAGFHFDQDIARLQLRARDFFDYQGLLEFMQNGSLQFKSSKESAGTVDLRRGQASVNDPSSRKNRFIS
jgi:hypothetical protein